MGTVAKLGARVQLKTHGQTERRHMGQALGAQARAYSEQSMIQQSVQVLTFHCTTARLCCPAWRNPIDQHAAAGRTHPPTHAYEPARHSSGSPLQRLQSASGQHHVDHQGFRHPSLPVALTSGFTRNSEAFFSLSVACRLAARRPCCLCPTWCHGRRRRTGVERYRVGEGWVQ